MATQASPSTNREVVVRINVDANGRISVTPDRFKVHKHQDQYVRWECPSGEHFTVEFEGVTPFYEFQYSKDCPSSGLVRRNHLPMEHRAFKYTVRVGDQVLDPEGEVEK